MDEFKKKGLPQEYKHYLTPPSAPVRKDRGMTRRQRRRLAQDVPRPSPPAPPVIKPRGP